MSGKFKTFDGTTLCLGHPPGPDSSHTVAANANVTLNGKAASIASLKADDNITLSGDPVTLVTAIR